MGNGWMRLAGLAALVALWQAAVLVDSGGIAYPQPWKVAVAWWGLVATGDLVRATLTSLGRVVTGFVLAAAVAIPLGVWMGASPRASAGLRPLLEAFRPIAPIAWLPLAILWFGTGTPAALFLIAYAAFFPLLVNTTAGVQELDRTYVDVARVMGVPWHIILLRVMLPGALPQALVGVRIGLGTAWTAVIAAELAVGAKSGGGGTGGIGSMMFTFYAYSVNPQKIVAAMITVGLVALLLDRGLRLINRRLLAWRPSE